MFNLCQVIIFLNFFGEQNVIPDGGAQGKRITQSRGECLVERKIESIGLVKVSAAQDFHFLRLSFLFLSQKKSNKFSLPPPITNNQATGEEDPLFLRFQFLHSTVYLYMCVKLLVCMYIYMDILWL